MVKRRPASDASTSAASPLIFARGSSGSSPATSCRSVGMEATRSADVRTATVKASTGCVVFSGELVEIRTPPGASYSSADPERFVFAVDHVYKGDAKARQSVVTPRGCTAENSAGPWFSCAGCATQIRAEPR